MPNPGYAIICKHNRQLSVCAICAPAAEEAARNLAAATPAAASEPAFSIDPDARFKAPVPPPVESPEPADGAEAALEDADEEPFNYTLEMNRLTMCLPVLAMVRIDDLSHHHQRAETLGPLLEPTKWIRGGAQNLEEQAELLRAAGPLVRFAKDLMERSGRG